MEPVSSWILSWALHLLSHNRNSQCLQFYCPLPIFAEFPRGKLLEETTEAHPFASRLWLRIGLDPKVKLEATGGRCGQEPDGPAHCGGRGLRGPASPLPSTGCSKRGRQAHSLRFIFLDYQDSFFFFYLKIISF